MAQSDRRRRAHALARQIERTENCSLLTNDSVGNIEHTLTEYAVDRLKSLRAAVVADTINLAAKARAVELIDAAIRKESEE